MVRSVILRLPFVRALIPRISRPILPLTARRSASESLSLSRGRSSTRIFHNSSARLNSSSSSPHSESGQLPPNASLSQRLKHLIKSYGWYALGMYIILSTIDFSVAFAAVNILGAEHVSHAAAAAKEFVLSYLPTRPPEPGREEIDSAAGQVVAGGHEGLYAMLLVAYTIHKTLFLPVRVGLTAVLTPRLVTWLRSRGWAGGAGTKRAVQEMRDRFRDSRERK